MSGAPPPSRASCTASYPARRLVSRTSQIPSPAHPPFAARPSLQPALPPLPPWHRTSSSIRSPRSSPSRCSAGRARAPPPPSTGTRPRRPGPSGRTTALIVPRAVNTPPRPPPACYPLARNRRLLNRLMRHHAKEMGLFLSSHALIATPQVGPRIDHASTTRPRPSPPQAPGPAVEHRRRTRTTPSTPTWSLRRDPASRPSRSA